MSTPLPGQIRCPTCHRSTPPAAFCTQCGTAISDSARARPRGLDREELQDRIRTHRPGDAAFRRGSQVGGGVDQGASVYRPYQPEPEDELVLPGAAADEGTPARVDNTPPHFDEPPPVIVPPPAAVQPPPVTPPTPTPAAAVKPPPREPQAAPWKPAPPSATPPPPPPRIVPVAAPEPEVSAPDEPYAAEPDPPDPPDPPDYRYRNPGDDRERRDGGMSPLAIGGFVLLGVLAIGVGAVMAGLFSNGVAVASPSPTPQASSLPSVTAEPSLVPSSGPSVPASLGPTASPTAAPDEFTARTEPCIDQPSSQDGCGSSGSTVNSGSVWVWVGWRKGSDADTLGVHIEDDTGASVGTGTLALSSIGSNGCGESCNGWARFKFGGLDPGNYTIRVDRNGAPVAEATFTVNG